MFTDLQVCRRHQLSRWSGPLIYVRVTLYVPLVQHLTCHMSSGELWLARLFALLRLTLAA